MKVIARNNIIVTKIKLSSLFSVNMDDVSNNNNRGVLFRSIH